MTQRVLTNHSEPFIRTAFLSRRLIPHRQVTLVSPFITRRLLLRTGLVGKLLDDLLFDGAIVQLITSFPAPSDFGFYTDLSSRGYELYFHPAVHAKLYLFDVDPPRLRATDDYRSVAIVGSANLTDCGLNLETSSPNEELCVEFSDHPPKWLVGVISRLKSRSVDLVTVRLRYYNNRTYYKGRETRWS